MVYSVSICYGCAYDFFNFAFVLKVSVCVFFVILSCLQSFGLFGWFLCLDDFLPAGPVMRGPAGDIMALRTN